MKDLMEKELRILILEDVPSDAILIERELRRAKIHLCTQVLQTREDFLQHITEFHPDIILSDYMMPQFDGMTALSITKELAPSVPFILITGSINEETAVECMKAGAADYILKDRLARLPSAVVAALDKYRTRSDKELAEEKLQWSEQRFRALIENSSDVITIISADGMIKYISPSVERVLGHLPGEVTGKHVLPYIHPDDVLPIKHFFGLILQHARTTVGGLFRLSHIDGTYRDVEVIGNNLLEETGVNGIVCNFRDVSERKRTTEALRQSEERYRKLVELSPDTIFVQRDGKIVFINPAGVKLLGAASFQELIGKPVLDIVHPYYRPLAREQILNMREGDGETVTLVQEKLLRLDETPVDVEVASTPFTDQDRPAAQVIARDITERRQAEEQLRRSHEQLRALTAHLQSIREEERTRIAREIHDELGQELTALKMDLSSMEKRLARLQHADGKEILTKIESMYELIDRTIWTIRRISTELRPGILDDLGLAAAIEWQAQEFQHRTGIDCTCISCLDEITSDRERSTAVFRIFQEALTNIARHAKATSVSIKLERADGNLILEVRDNGRGITKKEIAATHSLGLLGMRERAAIFGGTVDIGGNLAEGTAVTVVIPLTG